MSALDAVVDQNIDQFISKFCTESATISANSAMTGAIGKDKYKSLKVEIVAIGNKILIAVKLFNRRVKAFYLCMSRSPKDPADFDDYEPKTDALHRSLATKFNVNVHIISTDVEAQSDEITFVIDKSDTQVEFVYLGVKGVEEDNMFEVKFDDCAYVDCRSKASLSTMKLSVVLRFVYVGLFLVWKLFHPSFVIFFKL